MLSTKSLIFSYFPAVELFFLSVADWDGFLDAGEFLVGLPNQAAFVGLDNYVDLLNEPEELKPLLVSLYYFVGAVVQLALSLWFAVLVNTKLIGRNLFKTFLFLPFVLNAVAASMVFQIFYQVQGGLDSFLSLLGCDSFFTVVENGVEVVKYPEWLANPQIVNWALVAASVWRYLGFNLILFYGVLQSIPQDQYEAARIEGATEWQQFRFITLPSIKMILGLQALLAFVGSLSVFDIPYPYQGCKRYSYLRYGDHPCCIRAQWLRYRISNGGYPSNFGCILHDRPKIIIQRGKIVYVR